jgi:hypothetical protein
MMSHKPQGYKYKSIEAAAIDLHRNVDAEVLHGVAFSPDGPLDRAMGGKRPVEVDLGALTHSNITARERRRRECLYRQTGVWVR